MTNIFSRNLKFLRKLNKETQASIALELGKTNTAISNWELGLTEPNMGELLKISRYYGISIDTLISQEVTDAHLTDKLNDSKNQDNAHLNAHLNAHPIGVNSLNEPPVKYDSHLGMPKVITLDYSGRDNIVHVPIKARAGYLLGYGDPEYIKGLTTYSMPGLREGTFRSFEAEGNSMNPTIKNKDIIIGRYVESFSDMRENRVHIVVTKHDGILIKRTLNRISERGKLYLKSDNITNRQDYPTIELEPMDVLEIWYGTIKFGTDFSEPTEYFTRLNDLEIKMMEVFKTLQLK